MLKPKTYNLKANPGYIALTSVIIISLLLITVTAAISSANYFSRFNILENEYKSRSSSLAESCVDYAISRIISSSSYTGGECINVGSNTCRVVSVAPQGSNKRITTQAMYQNSYTNLEVEVSSSYITQSWEEVSDGPVYTCS